MNERVMQFRIGMFVIVAGLVLTMLIVWFGESPALFRPTSYLRVRFPEAPGVNEGIPVRKSGIRIGEVASVAFEERPNQPDSVLVTLAIEGRYRIKEGSKPRISRALIGDVSIDMLPGPGPGNVALSADSAHAPVIEGYVAPDPANALVAATATLESINKAANGIADMTKKTQNLDQLLSTWQQTGQRMGTAATSIDQLVKENQENLKPAIANFRQFSERAAATFDPNTQAQFKAAVDRLATGAARFDENMAAVQPVLKDLGASPKATPTTNLGWGMMRFNRVMYDVGTLTATLTDEKGQLNQNGSIQKMVTRGELYDNMNRMAVNTGDFFSSGKLVMKYLNKFAEKIARNPSELTRGALRSP